MALTSVLGIRVYREIKRRQAFMEPIGQQTRDINAQAEVYGDIAHMLIRWVHKEDIESWQRLAMQVAELCDSPNMPYDESFIHYMHTKVEKYEAMAAVDRMSKNILGVIAFSRKNNRISWFAVSKEHRSRGIGHKLLKCAINQLDWQRDISITSFCKDKMGGQSTRHLCMKMGFMETYTAVTDEEGHQRSTMLLPSSSNKKAASFHHDYKKYIKYSDEAFCPPCTHDFMVLDGHARIADLDYSVTDVSRKAQGRLFGQCTMSPKLHVINFEDMPPELMVGFMRDVQIVGSALRKVTGAIKINYEMHANSGPHLHIRLFPRYLDDDFPGAPINTNLYEPSPYESDEEFLWFVEKMRNEIAKIKRK